MRIFLDTNVLASSIATRGLCSELLESIIHDHQLLTCRPVLDELERILLAKFNLPEAVVAEFLGLLKTQGEMVQSRSTPSIPIKDANDIRILACALGGKAEVFVTGDKELLDLQQVGNLPIVSPRQLWLKLAGLDERSTRK